mmetsp:Transcript_31780/g.64687  ORF Transcript_31780/g.64687 Transcript_31780/m.64687 type:complete len:99 (-) Transcript_31780:1129-1425(-)
MTAMIPARKRGDGDDEKRKTGGERGAVEVVETIVEGRRGERTTRGGIDERRIAMTPTRRRGGREGDSIEGGKDPGLDLEAAATDIGRNKYYLSTTCNA